MRLARGLILIAGTFLASLAAPVGSLAATVTVNFSGTIQAISDPFGLTTYSSNDTISGVPTIGPLAATPTINLPPPVAHSVYEGAASFDFAPISGSGQASIATQNIFSGLGYFGIFFQSATSELL